MKRKPTLAISTAIAAAMLLAACTPTDTAQAEEYTPAILAETGAEQPAIEEEAEEPEVEEEPEADGVEYEVADFSVIGWWRLGDDYMEVREDGTIPNFPGWNGTGDWSLLEPGVIEFEAWSPSGPREVIHLEEWERVEGPSSSFPEVIYEGVFGDSALIGRWADLFFLGQQIPIGWVATNSVLDSNGAFGLDTWVFSADGSFTRTNAGDFEPRMVGTWVSDEPGAITITFTSGIIWDFSYSQAEENVLSLFDGSGMSAAGNQGSLEDRTLERISD